MIRGMISDIMVSELQLTERGRAARALTLPLGYSMANATNITNHCPDCHLEGLEGCKNPNTDVLIHADRCTGSGPEIDVRASKRAGSPSKNVDESACEHGR